MAVAMAPVVAAAATNRVLSCMLRKNGRDQRVSGCETSDEGLEPLLTTEEDG